MKTIREIVYNYYKDHEIAEAITDSLNFNGFGQPLVEIEEKDVVKLLRNYSTIDGQVYHAEIVAKAITAKFGQRRMRVPEKKKEHDVCCGSFRADGHCCTCGVSDFNQAIDTFIEMNGGGE